MEIYNKRGFTLIELLVAIGIMATLIAIMLPNFMGARERAKDSQKVQDLSAMKNALRLYYNDVGAYPTGTAPAGMLGAGFSGYMTGTMKLGYTYEYYQESNGDAFVVCTGLDAGMGNDDINSQERCGIESLNKNYCGLGVGKTGDKVYVACVR